jgi:threonine/homoserine/homoserine lactone efflux protein
MFLQFVGITMVNPMTIVYFTALILGEGRAHDGHTLIAGLLFVLGVGIASFSWQTGLAAVGGLARNRLAQRFRLVATVMGNLLVILLGARILIFAFVP